MINRIKIWHLGMIVVALFVAQSITAQNKTTRQVSGFDELSVSGSFDVEIVQGNTESLEIEATDKILEQIITEVKGNKLRIYMKKGNWNGNNNWKTPKIYLKFKSLNAISASASADIVAEGKVKAKALKLDASSAGDIRIEDLQATEIECNASSGADIDIEGSANSLDADASSGADINAGKFMVKICEANASSGADISVNVKDELRAEASSGADINYKGSPQKIKTNSSSGGDVNGQN